MAVAGILAFATPHLAVQAQDQESQNNNQDDNGAPTGVPSGVPTGVPAIDDLFAKVAEQEPGFGGMFIDEEQDILFVFLLDGNLDVAVAALRDVLKPKNLPGNVQVLQAQFSFLQLKEWHDRIAELFQIPGVVETDIDDANNRLSVGVENQEARVQVWQN